MDNVIPEARMYIEIDDKHHSTNPMILKADLEHDYYSNKKGYVRKRLTINQIESNLEEIVGTLVIVAKQRIKHFGEK